MSDYKKMYLTMVDAAERAMAVLIEAEQVCEELYVSAAEPALTELSKKADAEKAENFPLASRAQMPYDGSRK